MKLELYSQDPKKKKKINKWHPYKFHLVQKLSEDDFDRRAILRSYYGMINDRLFLNNIVFSDETTFELTENVNEHNCRTYLSDITHWMRENLFCCSHVITVQPIFIM